jgi:hypothetical protein
MYEFVKLYVSFWNPSQKVIFYLKYKSKTGCDSDSPLK